MEEKGWKVYAQINPAGEVTRIYSDAFEEPGEGAVLIGEGNGDRYAHAQSRYLAKDIRGRIRAGELPLDGGGPGGDSGGRETGNSGPRQERAGDIAGDGGHAGHFRTGRVRKMFETLKRLYHDGTIGMAQLENAVAKGWITEEEMQEISGGKENGQTE